MATIAQQALQAFEDAFKTTDWAAKTAAQKQTFVAQHYGLKIDAAKEIEANRIADEAAQAQAEATRKQAWITKLQSKGFYCDNSQHDWYLLYNRPKIFGANWQVQADYQMSLSTGVDYFLNKAYELYTEIVGK